MIIGFPQNGSPFVELIVLIDFQNTSAIRWTIQTNLVIVAHTLLHDIRRHGAVDANKELRGTGAGGAGFRGGKGANLQD